MNSKSRVKRYAAYAAALLLTLSAGKTFAQSDDFGVWSSLTAKKKLTDKLSLSVEGELRTIDGISDMDRRSISTTLSYKFTKWLKADVGYVYIQSHNGEEKKLKEYKGDDIDGNPVYNYNIDHSYWEERDRFYRDQCVCKSKRVYRDG